MRNERKADIVFALSAILFAAVFWWRLQDDRMGVTFLYFLAQSAFIGSAADWFAVTALFKRPLGFPFHTALIPAHREQIIRSIRRVVEKRLVQSDTWGREIEAISIMGYACKKLQEEGVRVRFESWCAEKAAEEVAQWLEQNGSAALFQMGKKLLPREEAVPAVLQHAVLREERLEQVLAWILDKGAVWAEQKETAQQIENYLKQFVREKKGNPLVEIAITMGESIGLIHYGDMAASIQQSLVEECRAWKSEGHPMHLKLKKQLKIAVAECLNDPLVVQMIKEEWGHFQKVIPIQEWSRQITSCIAMEWFNGSNLKQKSVPLFQSLVSQGIDTIFRDMVVCRRLDHLFRIFLLETAMHAHSFIGETTEAVLNAYDTDKLNDFVHSKVHEELGWIRINGALVAASAGLFLCMIIEMLWRPLIG